MAILLKNKVDVLGLVGVWTPETGPKNLAGNSYAFNSGKRLYTPIGVAGQYTGNISSEPTLHGNDVSILIDFTTGSSIGTLERVIFNLGITGIGFHASHNNAAYSGAIWAGSAYNIIGKPSGGTLLPNTRYVVGVGVSGATGAIYSNGSLVATASGLSARPSSGSLSIGQQVGGTEVIADGLFINYLYVSNRKLSDAIFYSIAKNPWQIFKSKQVVYFIPSTILNSYSLIADLGSYGLTSYFNNLFKDSLLVSNSASYSENGINANLLSNKVLINPTIPYSENGINANLLSNKVLINPTIPYSENGINANLLSNKILISDFISFSLVGKDATLIYTPAGSYILTGDTGAFSSIPYNASLLYNKIVNGSLGSFSISSISANLLKEHLILGDKVNYDLIGKDATLVYSPSVGYTLSCSLGTFSISSSQANLLKNSVLTSGSTSYLIDYKSANLIHGLPSDTLSAKSIWQITILNEDKVYQILKPNTTLLINKQENKWQLL